MFSLIQMFRGRWHMSFLKWEVIISYTQSSFVNLYIRQNLRRPQFDIIFFIFVEKLKKKILSIALWLRTIIIHTALITSKM